MSFTSTTLSSVIDPLGEADLALEFSILYFLRLAEPEYRWNIDDDETDYDYDGDNDWSHIHGFNMRIDDDDDVDSD